MKLLPKQAEAITRLLTNPDFRVYMDLLGDEAEKSMMLLIKATGDLATKQGRCQVYTELLEAIGDAKSTLESYQNSKQRKN